MKKIHRSVIFWAFVILAAYVFSLGFLNHWNRPPFYVKWFFDAGLLLGCHYLFFEFLNSRDKIWFIGIALLAISALMIFCLSRDSALSAANFSDPVKSDAVFNESSPDNSLNWSDSIYVTSTTFTSIGSNFKLKTPEAKRWVAFTSLLGYVNAAAFISLVLFKASSIAPLEPRGIGESRRHSQTNQPRDA